MIGVPTARHWPSADSGRLGRCLTVLLLFKHRGPASPGSGSRPGDHPGGALVPAVRPVLPRCGRATGRTRHSSGSRHDLPVGSAVHPRVDRRSPAEPARRSPTTTSRPRQNPDQQRLLPGPARRVPRISAGRVTCAEFRARTGAVQSVPVLARCGGRVHTASSSTTSARAAAEVDGGARSGSPHAPGLIKGRP